MRCPHCAGEILDGSRFCGICGRRLASATIPAGGLARAAAAGQPEPPSAPARVASPGKPRPELVPVAEGGIASLELPISRGARWARILAVLALDVALAGAGVAMIVSFARDCEGIRGTTSVTSSAPGPAEARAGAATGGEREMPEARP